MNFDVTFTTKWSDFDPNRHMRHTAYNDYAAETRVRYFKAQGLSIEDFAKENLGPILFKEETSFFKEIHMGEDIRVDLKLRGLSENFGRWKLEHLVYNQAGEISAKINVYGAWIDLNKRKLAIPSSKFHDLFDQLQKTEDFEEITRSQK